MYPLTVDVAKSVNADLRVINPLRPDIKKSTSIICNKTYHVMIIT